MESAFNGGLVLLPVLYTVLIIAYARLFLGAPLGVARIARPLIGGTIVVHLLLLLFRGFDIGACPLGNPWEKLSLIALSLAITYWFVELRIRNQSTGVFLVGAAALLQFTASVALLSTGPPPIVKLGGLLSLYSLADTIGFSAVAVSSIYALIYLLLYQAIKRGRFGIFFQRIPDLETLTRQNHAAALLASIALSVGVGALLYGRLAGSPGPFAEVLRLEHVLTIATWAFFTGVLIARRLLVLGGKRFAYGTLLGLPPSAVSLIALVLQGGGVD